MSRDSSTSFHDKNTQKLEKNFTNLIQIIFLKIAANIILNSKMLSFPPLRSGTRQGYPLFVVVVQSLSCVQLCDFSMPGLQHTRLHCPPLYLLQFVQTAVKLYNHLILCRSLPFSPSIIPSLRLFSNESALRIRWPKYWSFSFGSSPSNEHPGLISFRLDWLDFLAVQGTRRIFSNTTIQKHQFFSTKHFSWSSFHNCTWALEKP